MYNNILVFIVGGEPNTRSEMHIFQVSDVVKFILMLTKIQVLSNLRRL